MLLVDVVILFGVRAHLWVVHVLCVFVCVYA